MTTTSPLPVFDARSPRMKRLLLRLGTTLIILLGILPFPALSVTAICGFNTVTVNGTNISGSYRFSFAGLSLVPVAEYSGKATAIGANTLVEATAGWTSNPYPSDGTYYVEITSVNGSTTASGVGATYTISSAAASTGTLTLAANLTAGMTAPVGYTVRKHWTIASLFGAGNAAGFTGGNLIGADTIMVWAGGSSFNSYFYQTGVLGAGWRKSTDLETDASNTVIRPEHCLIVRRLDSSSFSFKICGMVKTGQTTVTVVQGGNYIPSPFAANMTLGSCGIYTGNSATGLAAGSVTTADQVLIPNGAGYDAYYYQNSGIGGTGWRKIGAQNADAGATVIAPGTGVIVRRINSGSFSWVMPQHPASL